MELQQYLTILKERWSTAAIAAVLVLAVVSTLTLTRTPTYTATNRVFVQTEAGGSVSERSSGVNFASQQIITYADLAKTPIVLDPVIEELGLDLTADELADRISTTIPEDTLIIDITASSVDPEVASAIANATSESLRTQVSALEAPTQEAAATGTTEEGLEAVPSTVELTEISAAATPSSPASPNIPRDLALGVLLTLLAGLAAAVVRDFLDNRVRRPADIEALYDLPVIGSIPSVHSSQNVALIAAQKPSSVQAEAYRELRTNLHFMLTADRMNTLLVTSSLSGEGKSSTAINLAQVLAQAGGRVLLVDADLRRPSLATELGLERTVGLTTVLIGDVELDDVTQPLETAGLDVLTSGPIPPNPSELLGSEAMRSLLEAASEAYDYVVVDTAPLLAVTDAVALSRFVDGSLVVAQSDRVKKQQLGEALAKMDSVDARVLGVVVNNAPRDVRDVYTYLPGEESSEPAVSVVPAEDRPAEAWPEEARPSESSEHRSEEALGAEEATGDRP
ncbi:polysaccharide biosynthesis tyrosine autokinase, partial [Brachybacterium sp. HMSC06H03]|uniref:polysaccharide biosynthesis tyrosine autokinase n=1 Tax=Brachybacterium sp. HMSC06H03 TaxID=1581127 RepID=UPI001438D509